MEKNCVLNHSPSKFDAAGTEACTLEHPLMYMFGSSICRAGAQNKTGFLYFGMHGALPVYSLKCSHVEGQIRWLSYIMPSDGTGLSSCHCSSVYDAVACISIYSLRHLPLSSSVHPAYDWLHLGPLWVNTDIGSAVFCQNTINTDWVL